ncbi:MAG: response regulator transcription factor [Polyangiaceae bacterium]|jgi:DNA-binding NarL/FixJ family response regulator|nr:response regulator transcription factor [Polyangiaceae bacterium]
MTRLLLVEDEDDARASLVRTLTREGYTCEAAANEVDALALLKDGRFDGAVVDVVLGKKANAGLDMVPELLARTGQAPVIIITAFADMGKVKAALNAGASYMLEKPFTAADLLAVLRRLLVRREDLSPFVERALSRARLTDKERNVARLVLKGLPTAEIARLERNSEKTVRQHLGHIYAKCGVASRAEFFHYVFPS